MELTFSVVVRDTTSAQGYSTLDVECETADMYYLLLRGFRLLQEEAEAHRALQRNSGGSSSNQGSGRCALLDCILFRSTIANSLASVIETKSIIGFT